MAASIFMKYIALKNEDEENIDEVATLFLKNKCENLNDVAEFYVDYVFYRKQ